MGKNKTAAQQSGAATIWRDLEIVIRQLHDGGLRVGIQVSDAGMQVWISDRLHRVREERVFRQAGAHSKWREDSAALWLHDAALRLFPEKAYARRFRRGVNDSDDAGQTEDSVDPDG